MESSMRVWICQMQQRGISSRQVLDCLMKGQLDGPAYLDDHENWRVEIGQRVAGARIKVVASLMEDPDGNKVVVITTFRD